MLSQFPTWFIFAAVVLGCGCIATVLFMVRDTERRLQGLGEESDLKLAEHDEAFGQLEGRVEDMSGRLFNAAGERRELSRLNQRLSGDRETWANELKSARGSLSAQGGELAQLREQHLEVSERLRAQRTTLEEKQTTISGLEADLAGKTRQLEAIDRQRGEIEELHRRERDELQQRVQGLSEFQGTLSARVAELEATLAVKDRVLQESAAEARVSAQTRQDLATRVEQQADELLAAHRRTVELEAASSARVGELERELERCEKESRDRLATIESLQRDSSERDLRADGLQDRCRELEEQSRSRSGSLDSLAAELESMRREASAAREHGEELERQLASHTKEALEQERGAREREHAWSARVSDLEADLARNATAWHERTATHEAQQREIASKERELAAARERFERLERQAELDQERARSEHEAHGALALRVSELEGDLAQRDEAARERAAFVARLEADNASRGREVESVEERCRELVLEMRRLQEEEVERRRRELEIDASHAGRVRELESSLQEREGEMEVLRVERTLLSAQATSISHELDAGRQELRDCEQRLADAAQREQASKLEIERCLEASELERAPIDPLVEGRILQLFKRGGVPATELLPDGYLSGLEQGDLSLALRSLLGGVEPLSASAMESLAGRWRKERTAWKQAPFQQQVVYLWANGIFVKAGLGEEGQALLCVFAAFVDGSRSLVAVEPGNRASKEDWLAILRNLERRGMGVPRLVVAEETLGILDALDELGWNCLRQRCWSQRIDEVVSLLPKNRQSWATEKLRGLTTAESRVEAKDLRDQFVKRCGVRNAAAAERLCADWRQMTNFYSFPKSHWPHLRTTSVVESPFTAIRLRSGTSRPGPTNSDAESMLWKLLVVGEYTFRKLNSPLLLPGVARGDAFVDGLPDEKTRVRAA